MARRGAGRRNQAGFSLQEVLVVVALGLIVSAAGLPRMSNAIANMKLRASMVCVLSILLRLLVAIALTIKVSMLIEPITRIAPAIRVSIIVMPDSGFLTLALSAILSNLIRN